MILADLPPVGDRVETTRAGLPLPNFAGYHPLWLHSGTAALALALWHARQQRPELATPEVIVPAYGCPDLVAAAVYAGAKPVIVDIGASDPGFDLTALRRALSKHTLAVIAVNFLGIRERLEDIRALLPAEVSLVEDSAQWYPELDGTTQLAGDYVITSFGRGKPASVLGGGLLLLREGRAADARELAQRIRETRPESIVDRLRYRGKIALYNLLRQPGFYFWLNRNPFLGLGATRYQPLGEIRPMSAFGRAILGANIRRHLGQSRWREAQFDRLIAELPGVEPLGLGRRGRLLRYPVLCASREQRERLLSALQGAGLGASSMYQRPLMEIPGIEALAVAHETTGASGFAGRLLTLPLHSGVKARHLQRIQAICGKLLKPC